MCKHDFNNKLNDSFDIVLLTCSQQKDEYIFHEIQNTGRLFLCLTNTSVDRVIGWWRNGGCSCTKSIYLSNFCFCLVCLKTNHHDVDHWLHPRTMAVEERQNSNPSLCVPEMLLLCRLCHWFDRFAVAMRAEFRLAYEPLDYFDCTVNDDHRVDWTQLWSSL